MSKSLVGFELFQVGWHKGECDFGVSAVFTELSYEQMKEWREMVVVAIGVAEDIWRRAQEEKPENRANTTLGAPAKEQHYE